MFFCFPFEIRFSKGRDYGLFALVLKPADFSQTLQKNSHPPRAPPLPLFPTPFRRSAGARDGPAALGRKGVRKRGRYESFGQEMLQAKIFDIRNSKMLKGMMRSKLVSKLVSSRVI